jgi:hypothetical protein
MAIKWPLANGNWSNAANWNDGTLPDVGDDVHADGKAVTIDQDVTVLSIRNDQRSGGTANGGFNFATTLTTYNITADLIAFNTALITFNQGSRIYNITGNVDFIAGTTNNINGLTASTGNVEINIVGNVTAVGQGFGRRAINLTAQNILLNITGNLIGGTPAGGVDNCAVAVGSFNTVTITGNVTNNTTTLGSFLAQAPSAIFVGGSNTILNVYGNVIQNQSTNNGNGILIVSSFNTVNLYGQAIGKFSLSGLSNAVNVGSNNNTIRINKITGSDNGTGVAVYNLTTSNVIVKEFEISAIGTVPAIGKIIVDDNTFAFKAINESNQTVIYSDNVLDFIPTEPNVRKNTTYYDGLKVGTLEVPDPSNVRKGVPTDNTVGTADLTAEDILNAILTSENPVAERLRNVSTVQTSGSQLQAYLDQ